MTLSDLSIKRPVFAWMLMIAILVLGGIAYKRLGVSQMPDVDFPVVSITSVWPGAAPEVMEVEVVDPLEESLLTIDGIKNLNSTVRYGQALIVVEFELNKNIDTAMQEVQSKILQAQRQLPPDLEPPIIRKVNFEDLPIMWVGVGGGGSLRELMRYVRDHLQDKIQTVPGVAGVFLGGYREPIIKVELKPEEMRRLDITVADILNALQEQHIELPSGKIENERRSQNVRLLGEAPTVEELRKILIPVRVGAGVIWQKYKLSDVAYVKEDLESTERTSRVNGKPAVGMGILKQRGTNAIEVAHRIKALLEEIRKELPPGYSIGINFDSTQFVEESMDELMFNLILATILTSFVCFLFLGSFSSTINVLLAIPTSIGGAFLVMYFLGFTMNTLTMLGLSLVIGIVVDDAIMVLENIVRHREQGESRIQAAVIGAREITFAAIAASVAIIAIFLPVAFMKGIVGKFFYQFGVTVSIAVAFSLLEAITITPMRLSQFLEVHRRTFLDRGMDYVMKKLSSLYKAVLPGILRYRWLVLFLATVIFFGSLSLTKFIGKELTPSQDMGRFLVNVQTPIDSSLEYTDGVARNIEAILASRPEIETYFSIIGGFTGGEVNTARFLITMKPLKERPRNPRTGKPITQDEFMQLLRPLLKEVRGVTRVAVQDLSQGLIPSSGGGMRGYPLDLSLRGKDWEKLGAYATQIMERLEKTGLVVDLDTNYQVGAPEIRVIPHRERCNAYGVTVRSVALTLNATIGDLRAVKFTEEGRRYYVWVGFSPEDRRKLGDFRKVYVRNLRGELVPLMNLVRIEEVPTNLTIYRENRERSVHITANIAPGKSQAEALAAAEKIAREILPPDYRVVPSGAAQTFKESFQELIFALVLGIVIAYMILGAQFNSFIHPFTVLLALPFSVTGAFVALWLTKNTLNLVSFIGILLLMGIVKKNSILLVDFTNALREEGYSVWDALITACPIRLRPILMTSASTVAGAIPLALKLGPGGELRAPMAITVMGGVIFSTFFTLVVVPAAYLILTRFESKRRQLEHQETVKLLKTLSAA